ncbi:hypothetical protein D9M68_794690 [compost metagenome]
MVNQGQRTLFCYHDHPQYGLMFHAFDAGALDTAEAQGEPIDVASQRNWIEQVQKRREEAETERKRLGELKKTHTYRQIADMEEISVREVKRRLGVL